MEDTEYKATGVIQHNENYVRLRTAIHHISLKIYKRLFKDPNLCCFSTDPGQLNAQLKQLASKLLPLQGKTLSDDEWQLLYPQDAEKFSVEDFTLNIFQAITQHRSENASQHYDALDKLLALGKQEKSRQTINASKEEFNHTWGSFKDQLRSLQFDAREVEELRTKDLEMHEVFRQPLLFTEIEVLANECEEVIKTINLNKLAMEKLMSDINQIQPIDNKRLIGDDFKTAASRVQSGMFDLREMLRKLRVEILRLRKDVRFWREKNLEGELIVLDERLVSLRNEQRAQNKTMQDLFHTTCLDMVKIKETHQFQNNKKTMLDQMRTLRSNSVGDIRVL